MRLAHLIAWLAVLALVAAPVSAWAAPVVIAIAASAAGSAIAAGAFGLVAGTLAYGLVSGAVGFAISSLASSMFGNTAAPKQDAGYDAGGSFQAEARGRTQVVRSSVETRKRVYGQVMLSGPLVYAETTGTDNQYLHLVIPLAPHSVYEIGDVYFNDELVGTLDGSGNVTTGRFADYARIKKHLGSTSQAADADLMADSGGIWTSAHRLQGVAYIYVRLKWSQDIYPNGIPNIKALVKGNDAIYDPRGSTSGYTDNWALCVRDYLVADGIDGGLECASDEIDDTYFGAAANVCDESVSLAGGGSQVRYTCNGTVDTGKRPVDILKDLMSAAAGVITYPAGTFRVFPAAYSTPTVTITNDDLRGPVQVTARVPRRELFNAVRGTYSAATNYWQPSDFPVVTNATYATNDGGEVIYRDLALPYTTDSTRAQRIAKIHLEKSRQGLTVVLPCKMTVFDLAMWDTVMVTNSAMGWSAKVFRVINWRLGQDGIGIDLTLREDTAASYDWASGDATTVDTAPDTNLPLPWSVSTPGTPAVTEEIYETTGSAGVKTRAIVSWAASADAFVVGYEAQYKPQAATDWLSLTSISLLTAQKDDLAAGFYNFRVRAINGISVRSDWSATTTKELLGLTAAPADVTGFTFVKLAGFGLAQLSKHPDLDVRIGGAIVIRYSSATSSTAWENTVIFEELPGDAVSGMVPLKTGTYFAKARDSSGNYSVNAVSFVVTEGTLASFSVVATLTEAPTFTGSKTNVAVVDSELRLDGTDLISDRLDVVSAWPKISSLGGISGTGEYLFSATMDCTTVATRRLEFDITAASFDTGDTIGARLDPVSEWDAIGGGSVNDCDVQTWVRTTNDDPAGSPTWSEWKPVYVAEDTFRAVQAKATFVSGQATHNISVSALTLTSKI